MWENSKLHGNLNNHKTVPPGAPLTYFNDGGGGGGEISDFFWSEILAQSDFLGQYERHRNFLGSRKRNSGIFGGLCKKDFFGACSKIVIFFWVEVVIFLGINYEPLLDPPPPPPSVIKICE